MSMKVVARLAGVSIPTVSRVLNARPNVAADTRKRVQRLLVQAGYEIKAVDRRSPRLVDVIVPDLRSPYVSALIEGLDEAASRYRTSLVLTSCRAGEDWLSSVAARRSRGVVGILSDFSDRQLSWLHDNEVPHAVIDPPSAVPPAGLRWITADNLRAGRDATTFLQGLGHRRIAFLQGLSMRVGVERQRGYCHAMIDAGFSGERYCLSARATESATGAAMDKLLDDSEPPTAVLASHDHLAAVVIAVARQRGIDVPGQLSVMGFDDVPESERFVPSLTTMHQPLPEMAAAALDHVLSGTTGAADPIELGMRLISRRSTSCIRTDLLLE